MPDNRSKAQGRRRLLVRQTNGSVTGVGSNNMIKATKKILLLHGNRQTGQLLLGRLEKLQKRLIQELQIEFIAPEAPFVCHADSDDNSQSLHLTWWNRIENDYQGLDETLELLRSPQFNNEQIVGIMGFSQGARLCHLLARLRQDGLLEKNCLRKGRVILAY